jgi:hypothetical protein
VAAPKGEGIRIRIEVRKRNAFKKKLLLSLLLYQKIRKRSHSLDPILRL